MEKQNPKKFSTCEDANKAEFKVKEILKSPIRPYLRKKLVVVAASQSYLKNNFVQYSDVRKIKK